MFKKIYLMNFITMMHVFGAASSSDFSCDPSSNVSSKAVTPMHALNDRLVELSLEFAPEEIKMLANRLKDPKSLDAGCDRALIVGVPGTGKTTLAKSLGLQSKHRIHFYKSAWLMGNEYIRSGITAIDTHLVPIIKLADYERQVVIIDEFDRLITAKEGEEGSQDRVTYVWQVLDDMFATCNILFIGTCNKTENFSAPLEDRLPRDCRYHIDLPSIALRTAALKYVLNIDASTTTYDTTITRAANQASNMSLRLLNRAACRAKLVAQGRKAAVPSEEELLAAIRAIRPEEDNAVVGAAKASFKFLKDNRETITTVGTVVSIGLAIYSHHNSIKHQEIMHADQKKFQEEQRQEQQRWQQGERLASEEYQRAAEERNTAFHRQLQKEALPKSFSEKTWGEVAMDAGDTTLKLLPTIAVVTMGILTGSGK